MTVNPEQVRRRIKTTIVRVLELELAPDDILDEAPLFGPALAGGLELDSLAAVEIVVGISNEFNIRMQDTPREAFQSVKTLGDFVGAKLADVAASA